MSRAKLILSDQLQGEGSDCSKSPNSVKFSSNPAQTQQNSPRDVIPDSISLLTWPIRKPERVQIRSNLSSDMAIVLAARKNPGPEKGMTSCLS